MRMNVSAKPNSLQTYQVLFYDQAFSEERFPIHRKRIVRVPGVDFEAWLMPGSHVLRFIKGGVTACEFVTDLDRNIPSPGLLSAFLAAGEHEFEHCLESKTVCGTTAQGRVTYMLSVQTETLSDNVYGSVFEEMRVHAKDSHSLAHHWEDDAGPCMSLIDVQRHVGQLHVQAYHLVASQGIVLRTQSIFEHA